MMLKTLSIICLLATMWFSYGQGIDTGSGLANHFGMVGAIAFALCTIFFIVVQ